MCDYLLKLGWPGVWFGGAAAGRASEPGVALMLRTGDGSMMDGQRRCSQLSSAITQSRIVREFGCPVGVFLAYTRRKVGVRPTLRIILARGCNTTSNTVLSICQSCSNKVVTVCELSGSFVNNLICSRSSRIIALLHWYPSSAPLHPQQCTISPFPLPSSGI